MIIHITSDYGQIGSLRWINSKLIPEEFSGKWLISWGAFWLGVNSIEVREVKR